MQSTFASCQQFSTTVQYGHSHWQMIPLYYGKSYLDNRIHFHQDGIIHNVHFLAIPMFERHTGAYMFKLVSEVFDIICPKWRMKLISMSSDGATSMTGEHSGIVTRIEQEVLL